MQFERPQNMAHLAQILRQVNAELGQTQRGLQGGAGAGVAELIRGAYDYADGDASPRAEARGVDALTTAQLLSDALGVAQNHVKDLAAQLRQAAQAMAEEDAKITARVADGNKFRV